MIKRTSLLEYFFSYAENLRQKDGRKALSANYLLLAVLKTMDGQNQDQIPRDLDTEETGKEWDAIVDWLNRNGIKRDAIAFLSKEVASSQYHPLVDELMFGKLQMAIMEKVESHEIEEADTTLYLEMIMDEPTEIIQNYLDTVKPEPAPMQSGDSQAQLLKELQRLMSAGAQATKPPVMPSADSTPAQAKAPHQQTPVVPREVIDEDDGMPARPPKLSHPVRDFPQEQLLAALVKSTAEIQKSLLDCVFGQDQAVNAFVSGYFQSKLMACSRSETQKPQAAFLFAGPPGVGKTFLAEKAAEALGLPYKRFDMSEYADKEANLEFCGSDKVYKNGKPGNVTEFVAEHPECVLLFDEIEKAHINIIYLFLQILDAGRIRDNFTDEEVCFSKAVIIFTTNVGKNLYDDPAIVNLSAVPRKKILKALATDVDPTTGVPLFPAAICSRFASGNVVMFNHLEANNLYTIAKRELENNVKGLEATSGIKIVIDDRVPGAIMFAEGGKADARTVKGRANAFFYEELYELFRLLSSGKNADCVEELAQINISVPMKNMSDEIFAMFENPAKPEVLVFAGERMARDCAQKLGSQVVCHYTDSVQDAKEILFNRDISIVLCDVSCGIKDVEDDLLNAEDINSDGHDFMTYVLGKYSLPVYILREKEELITQEEFLSFAKLGVRDVLTVRSAENSFAKQVVAKCRVAYRQGNMFKLARENKALSYKTSQTLSKSKKTATINLFDFKLSLITDTGDSKSILDNVSRPDVHFADVIGANDAKQELKYFVEYLKDPVKYMRKGVRSPKGVLLYGPPGTGKTLLAKAMAGESGVTFLRAEGNEFLKRYVGEGAEAVHSLFNAARKYAPAIVFVDEIDAIGKDRNAAGGDDHTSDVLTAFLTEMDGFHTDTSKPIFVLAATNYGVDAERGKSLDAALLRRFDRRIFIDLPNKEERKLYLQRKLAKHACVQLSDAQLDSIAMRSTGMSLAELESVFEMALRSAIRSEAGVVGDADFEEAFETFNGGEKKDWNPDTLKRTARHEAGHALVCWLGGEKPSYLTIVARGDHGGYMQHANSEGKGLYTKAELTGKIRTALAGRAAEIVYYGAEDGVSTGASGDLYSATRVAEQMICSYGMDCEVGMSYIDPSAIRGGENQAVRQKVNSMLAKQLEEAVRIIEANKPAIDAMVDALMEKNHLKETEIDEIFRRTAVPLN
ncbi:MAG: AAA family ATPase [Clostridia bacterium]|nr:AAA family ATPase [Clostridia bacterium]